MKIMRLGPVGAEVPVLIGPDGRHYSLTDLTDAIDADFLRRNGIDQVRVAFADDALPETDIAGQRIGAPVARPGVVVGIGMNYAVHAIESGATAPTEPVIFYKAPNTVVGPYDE